MTDVKSHWSKIVSKILKAEMAKRDITYQELVSKLSDLGISISAADLRVRANRGNFSAALLIQCMKAMGAQNVPLDETYFSE